jgi:3-dehydroquinate dehydratase-2
MSIKILLINGPNLNMLGSREPKIYGSLSLKEIEILCEEKAKNYGAVLESFQSNSESDIIEKIQKAKEDGFSNIIINAAAYSHTSIAILDALKSVDLPVIEVHLSNIYQRENFRQHSYISTFATAVICGLKHHGYLVAIDFICQN